MKDMSVKERFFFGALVLLLVAVLAAALMVRPASGATDSYIVFRSQPALLPVGACITYNHNIGVPDLVDVHLAPIRGMDSGNVYRPYTNTDIVVASVTASTIDVCNTGDTLEMASVFAVRFGVYFDER